MNKTELVGKVAERAGLTKKDTEKVVNSFIDVVQDTLAKATPWPSWALACFLPVQAKQRRSESQDRETIQIPASRVPVFRPGRGLRDSIAGYAQ